MAKQRVFKSKLRGSDFKALSLAVELIKDEFKSLDVKIEVPPAHPYEVCITVGPFDYSEQIEIHGFLMFKIGVTYQLMLNK